MIRFTSTCDPLCCPQVFDLGILPMSSSAVHLRAPLIKSLLLVGPAGSGKTLLTQIMSSELGATYFDLTAENLVDKYEGKKGAAMLINLVMKVSHHLVLPPYEV